MAQGNRWTRQDIFAAIERERRRQDKMWGFTFDDRNTINDWAIYMNIYLARATEMNRVTKVLDVERIKENFLKAIALGVAALEAIERNGAPAHRHYDIEEVSSPLPATGEPDFDGNSPSDPDWAGRIPEEEELR